MTELERGHVPSPQALPRVIPLQPTGQERRGGVAGGGMAQCKCQDTVLGEIRVKTNGAGDVEILYESSALFDSACAGLARPGR